MVNQHVGRGSAFGGSDARLHFCSSAHDAEGCAGRDAARDHQKTSWPVQVGPND